MKIYPSHDDQAVGPFSHLEETKVPDIGPGVSEMVLGEILGNLSAKLAPGHHGGAMIATAGFRRESKAAEATWARVREWNEARQLFEACDSQDNVGCRTLLGTIEAAYEMRALVTEARKRGTMADMGSRFGMASCGGASIQLGIWGGPPQQVKQCLEDLGRNSDVPDPGRETSDPSNHVVFFSWLADHEAPLQTEQSDNMVGGVNEMRVRFDEWLELSGRHANPCVSPSTDQYHAPSAACNALFGKGRPCLTDAWDNVITGLPGEPGSTRSRCRKNVGEFLASDMRLARWRGSSACRALAVDTPEWGFLTAFSSGERLGANITAGTQWSHVKVALGSESDAVPFETNEDLERRAFGKVLTWMLLQGFLRDIGLNEASEVRASQAEIADVAMGKHGLARGWAQC